MFPPLRLFRPPSIGRGALLVTWRNLTVWKRYAWASVFHNIGEPVLYLLAMGYGLGALVRDEVGGMSYAAFIAPGLVMSTAMNAAVFETTYGSYVRMEAQKTYAAILNAPITPHEVVAGDVIFSVVKAFSSSILVTIVVFAFGLVPSPWAALWLPLIGGVSAIAHGAMGLLVTSLAHEWDHFNYFYTLVLAPMFLFSGVFFPIEQLPAFAQHIAFALPLAHAVELGRAACAGLPELHAFSHLLWMLGLAMVMFVPAANLIERRLIQ